VGTPSDLISDPTRTPFNIGHAIDLYGFTLQEAQPLANGLEGKTANPQQLLAEILKWTGGQPFLTQKLCKLVLQQAEEQEQAKMGGPHPPKPPQQNRGGGGIKKIIPPSPFVVWGWGVRGMTKMRGFQRNSRKQAQVQKVKPLGLKTSSATASLTAGNTRMSQHT
jgi:hypothetical protein